MVGDNGSEWLLKYRCKGGGMLVIADRKVFMCVIGRIIVFFRRDGEEFWLVIRWPNMWANSGPRIFRMMNRIPSEPGDLETFRVWRDVQFDNYNRKKMMG